MSRPEVEKRKRKRRRERDRSTASGSDGPTDDSRFGVLVVVALVGIGGAADLAVGAGLLASPLFVFGIVVVSLGAVKLWTAVGLSRLRARALGVAILLHAVGALLGVGRAVFAAGAGGAPGPDLLGVLLDAGIVCYLLAIADRFE